MFINLDQVFFYCARYCFDLNQKFDKIPPSPNKTKYSLSGLISSGALRLNMNNKIGDSSLQLSFSFDDKKNGETSFQMDPGSVSSASSEMSVSWSEGVGSAEHHRDKDVSFGQQVVTRAKRRIRKTCTTKLLKRRLPMIEWLPKYTLQSLFHDCMAGFTVALTAIPQGIAYGAVAGVPVEVCFSLFF